LPFTARIERPSSIQARLLFRTRKDAHVGLVAAVERGPSQGARSGSTGPTWVPFPSFQARSSLLRGWGLIDLPLRASHRKAKAQVEVEGRKDAESDWSVHNLSLNLILLPWQGCALREHRRSSGSSLSSVPRAQETNGLPASFHSSWWFLCWSTGTRNLK
jgi:hypothetical protein